MGAALFALLLTKNPSGETSAGFLLARETANQVENIRETRNFVK
jgi:hypothetical protein